ncbi:MAG: ABC-ATPase domain-containing protein [Lachnospiraceae bacterium]|nr:ABC-ATPase domain-containing protein [Lachnospiraceae bacterium]
MDYNPTYFHGEIGLVITGSNKQAQDKPTLTWQIPVKMLGIKDFTPAAADYCLRAFGKYVDELNEELYNRSRTDKENGKYYLDHPGGVVLTRNTAFFMMCTGKDYENGGGLTIYVYEDEKLPPPRMCLCLRMQVQLPAKRLKKSIRMLCTDLPQAIDRFVADFDEEGLAESVRLEAKQQGIRAWLKQSDYCAFLANGSILPRLKGSDLPMKDAVPFVSVPGEEIEVCGVRGFGLKRGVTVITGGGYSGKSTLLDAVSAGIYNHILGDGRELCITDETAVTICAEEARSVKRVNISPFIKWLPGGDAHFFSTERASGSTSQAANIMEAVENGAKLLLMDEDRSATNFMIRDRLMKELIRKEPITPFTDRVGELHRELGVSTILVIGGSGEYLAVADQIYEMDEFVIYNVTKRAKRLCSTGQETMKRGLDFLGSIRQEDAKEELDGLCGAGWKILEKADWSQNRVLSNEYFTPYPEGSGREYLLVSDMGFLMIGDERIDVRGLHDIVSMHQLDALGYMLRYLEKQTGGSLRSANIAANNSGETGFTKENSSDEEKEGSPVLNPILRETIDLNTQIDALYEKIDREGLDCVFSSYFTTTGRFLDLPRKYELKAVINRMRKIRFLAEKPVGEKCLDE